MMKSTAAVYWWFVCVMLRSMKCLWSGTAVDISNLFHVSPDDLVLWMVYRGAFLVNIKNA